jgi:Gluconate 2-dehydrogenase subunit 3
MSARYPDYDVLAKRHTPSWNEKTRRVIDQRLAVPREPRFLSSEAFRTLEAICARIVPQPGTRPPIPVAALIDNKLFKDKRDGYRDHRLPPLQKAWRRGLRALDTEARARHGNAFHTLHVDEQDAMLRAAQEGRLTNPAWEGMSSKLFFAKRLLSDIVKAYYGHPTAWNEIGYGGPASPRGYVRMDFDRRDPWEAAEAKPGDETEAARINARIG